MRIPTFTIRVKLILISLLLLIIPFMGFKFAGQMKGFLEEGQRNTLLLTAQAVTSIIKNRPDLFDRNNLASLDEASELHAITLTKPKNLDGLPRDWPELDEAPFLGKNHILEKNGSYDPESFKYRYVLGIDPKHLYAFFQVFDDAVVHRDEKKRHLHNSDYLQIGLENFYGKFGRYFLTSHNNNEWVNAHLMHNPLDNYMKNEPKENEPRVQGRWRDVEGGYNIEIRIPLKMIGKKISFAIADVDDPETRVTKTIIGPSDTKQLSDLKVLLARSTKLEDILRGLENPDTKILIVDREMRVRAEQGSFDDVAYNSTSLKQSKAEAGSFILFLRTLFKPVYSYFSVTTPGNINASQEFLGKTNLDIASQALKGKTATDYYFLDEGKIKIMAAATPIRADGKIQAAVVVLKTSNKISAFQNQIIEKTIDVTILVFLVGAIALAIMATTLSHRIRKLDRQASETIGPDGRIIGTMIPSKARDEIGSLSRTLNIMFEKLQEYTVYQEKLSSNLEHEMRTPLAGISASLKNLKEKITKEDPETRDYIAEVSQNLNRLENILKGVTEATHLEEALKQGEQEVFDLGKAVTGQVRHVYKRIHIDVGFQLTVAEEELLIYGDPNRICQMLDKLVENGVDFRKPDTPITIRLEKSGNDAVISVANEGPILEEGMESQIFNLMVSGRKRKGSSPHMGLGLYVVRVIAEFHQGRVHATNRTDGIDGPEFIVHLPLDRKSH